MWTIGSGVSGQESSSPVAARVQGQLIAPVLIPAEWAASNSMGACTSSLRVAVGSGRLGKPSASKRSLPLKSTPCPDGGTPVTKVVWLVHVVEGLDTSIPPSGEKPWLRSRRRFGITAVGSCST